MELFITYEEVVNELLDYAHSRGITLFKRLKSEKYYDLAEVFRISHPTTSTQHVEWLTPSKDYSWS